MPRSRDRPLAKPGTDVDATAAAGRGDSGDSSCCSAAAPSAAARGTAGAVVRPRGAGPTQAPPIRAPLAYQSAPSARAGGRASGLLPPDAVRLSQRTTGAQGRGSFPAAPAARRAFFRSLRPRRRPGPAFTARVGASGLLHQRSRLSCRANLSHARGLPQRSAFSPSGPSGCAGLTAPGSPIPPARGRLPGTPSAH